MKKVIIMSLLILVLIYNAGCFSKSSEKGEQEQPKEIILDTSKHPFTIVELTTIKVLNEETGEITEMIMVPGVIMYLKLDENKITPVENKPDTKMAKF